MSTDTPPSGREPAVPPLGELAPLVWQLSRPARDSAHHRSGGGRCPTTRPPYGPEDPTGRRAMRDCSSVGCLDILHDVLTATAERLRRRLESYPDAVPRRLMAYANVAVRSELADRERRARAARGYPARPGRDDGVPGRVNAALRADVDPERGEWLVELFRIVRSYPHSPRRRGAAWPVDRLVEQKTAHDGRVRPASCELARREIRRDIATVLAASASVAGPHWTYTSILQPLHDCAPLDEDSTLCAVGLDDLADVVVTRAVGAGYLRARRLGLDRGEALAAAVGRLAKDVDVDDLAVAAALADLDEDLGGTAA